MQRSELQLLLNLIEGLVGDDATILCSLGLQIQRLDLLMCFYGTQLRSMDSNQRNQSSETNLKGERRGQGLVQSIQLGPLRRPRRAFHEIRSRAPADSGFSLPVLVCSIMVFGAPLTFKLDR